MIPSIVTNPPLNNQHSTFGRGLKCVLNFREPSTAINSHHLLVDHDPHRILSFWWRASAKGTGNGESQKNTHDLYKLILSPIKNKTGQAWSHLNIHRIYTNIIVSFILIPSKHTNPRKSPWNPPRSAQGLLEAMPSAHGPESCPAIGWRATEWWPGHGASTDLGKCHQPKMDSWFQSHPKMVNLEMMVKTVALYTITNCLTV